MLPITKLKVEKNFTFLATIGSTAPFWLVWYRMGIMNSFQSIAISRNTSLAIVAPGIKKLYLQLL